MTLTSVWAFCKYQQLKKLFLLLPALLFAQILCPIARRGLLASATYFIILVFLVNINVAAFAVTVRIRIALLFFGAGMRIYIATAAVCRIAVIVFISVYIGVLAHDSIFKLNIWYIAYFTHIFGRELW